MDGLTVLADAPVALPADAGLPRTTTIAVAKLGKYADPRYGKFSITREMAEAWSRNLASVFGGRVAIDLDHSPEKRGTTEAAGWITGLSVDGDYVKGQVEWTPLGESAIRERRYLFVSPTFSSNYRDEQDQRHGHALVGLALTNRPVLRTGMPVLSLAREPVFAHEEGADDTTILDGAFEGLHPRGAGGEFAAKRVQKETGAKQDGKFGTKTAAAVRAYQKKHGLKIDGIVGRQTAAAILGDPKKAAKVKPGALSKQQRSRLTKDPSDSRRRMDREKLIEIFTLDADASDDDIVAAAQAASERPEKPADSDEQTTLSAPLLEALGLDKEADEQKALDTIKALRDPEEGKTVLSTDEAAELRASAEAGKRANARLDDMTFSHTWDTTVREGRVAPADRDDYKALYQESPDLATKTLAKLPKLVNTEAGGGRGDDSEIPAGYDEESVKLDRKVQARMAEKGEDYVTALDAVVQADEQVAV